MKKFFELRIDTGKGYRVYFTNKDKEIIILLVGGNKSTQETDIQKAKGLAKYVLIMEKVKLTAYDAA